MKLRCASHPPSHLLGTLLSLLSWTLVGPLPPEVYFANDVADERAQWPTEPTRSVWTGVLAVAC